MSGSIAEERLGALLAEAGRGEIQAPEFQRDLELGSGWVTSLLASVSLGYPIGALTLLEAGNRDVRFATRALADTVPDGTAPTRLVIDGQHRLAALFRTLTSVSGDPYYIGVQAALDPNVDRDDAVVCDADMNLRAPEVQWELGIFPLGLVFSDPGAFRSWHAGFVAHAAPLGDVTRAALMRGFVTEVLDRIERYVIPTITVGADTTRWAVRVHGGPDGPRLSDQYSVR